MMKKALFFILLLSFVFAQNSSETTEDDLAQQLFEKAFKKKSRSGKTKQFYLPLSVNKILQDEVFVKIDENDNIFINQKTLLYILSLMKEEYQEKFSYKKDQTFYPLSILNQLGIKADYNNKDVQIDIYFPPEIKNANLIRLRTTKKKDINGSTLPSSYSGGFNLYLNQQYVLSPINNNLQRGNLAGSSDLFFNFHNYVLEGRVNYSEENENPLTRDRFALIKDDEENSIRYTLGDIVLPGYIRQAHRDALGVSIEKIFNINSNEFTQNASRINSYEFFLKNRSKVEIFINNQYSQTLTLNAGTHNLYDLQLPTGLNRIKLKIIEDGGKIEYIEFNDFSYSEVLKQGMVRYGVGMGISSRKNFIKNQWIYDQDQPITSSYIDYGVTNWLTLKTGLQTEERNNYSGAVEFLVGTPLGLFNSYMIYSDINAINGLRKGLDYRTDIQDVYINLGYETKNDTYQELNVYYYDMVQSTLYRANLFTTLGWGISLGFNASRYIKNDIYENTFGLDLSKNFFNTFDIRLNYDRVDRNTRESDQEFYLSFAYTWGHIQATYANYQNEQRHQVDISYDPENIYGLHGNFFYEQNPMSDRYNIRGLINDEKFRLDGSYSYTDYSTQQDQALDMQFATGVVFAGDKATITAPITSSFVIVDNDDGLEKPLGIEGFQKDDALIYDTFALPMGDYTERTLNIDERNLDFGIDLKNSEEKFITKYKSGSTMEIKVESFLSVKGVFLDKNTQKPIDYKAFKVFNTFTGIKTLGFTNENGEFTLDGIEEGQYNISFVHEIGYDDVARYQFKITKENLDKNLIDLGKLYIQMPTKKDIKNYENKKP